MDISTSSYEKNQNSSSKMYSVTFFSLSLCAANQEGTGCSPAGAAAEEGQPCLHLLLQRPGEGDI